MNPHDQQIWIERARRGDVTSPAGIDVDAYLAAHPECRAYRDLVEQTEGALRMHAERGWTRVDMTKVRKKVHGSVRARRLRLVGSIALVAASAAIGLVTSTWWLVLAAVGLLFTSVPMRCEILLRQEARLDALGDHDGDWLGAYREELERQARLLRFNAFIELASALVVAAVGVRWLGAPGALLGLIFLVPFAHKRLFRIPRIRREISGFAEA